MGGRLVLKILAEGEQFYKQSTQVKEFILQPQSEWYLFRKTIKEMGFVCEKEDMVFEDGKYYPMGRYYFAGINLAENKTGNVAETSDAEDIFYEYGEFLLKEKNDVLYDFLLKEERQLLQIKASLDGMKNEAEREKRYHEVEEKLHKNKSARDFYISFK